MTHAIDIILSIIFTLAGLVLGAIGAADAFLASLMTSAGVPADLQIALLIVVAVMLLVFAVRVLGGVFGILLAVLLVLLIAHRLFPGMQVPGVPPPQWQPSGTVHI